MTSAQLRDQLASFRNQHQELVLERERSLSKRENARRRLTLVAVAITDPLSAQAGSPPAANTSASRQSLGAHFWRWILPAPQKNSDVSSPARSSAKVKSKVGSAAKVAFKAGSSVTTSSKQVPVAVVPPKAGSKTGSATRYSSTMVPLTESAAVPSSKSGFGSKTEFATKSSSKPVPLTGSAAVASSKSESASKTGPATKPLSKTAGHFLFSSDDDDDGDGDPEDSEEARVADDTLEENMRRDLSQSRSEARRRSHSTLTKQVAGALGSGDGTAGSAIQIGSDDGLGIDDEDKSPHCGGSTGSALVAAPSNLVLPGMLSVSSFGPDATFIPGRLAPETFTADTIEP
ncbi:hypothetical protein PInf_002660 [Phytophthora infestans]|nr:hypothetical protein PInf_002660 [Phytophthora infestans]